jgi:hypothetical protein
MRVAVLGADAWWRLAFARGNPGRTLSYNDYGSIRLAPHGRKVAALVRWIL